MLAQVDEIIELEEPEQAQGIPQEIYKDALVEWYGLLAKLWIAVDKKVDKERLKIYAEALSEMPFGLLEAAVKRLLLTHEYSNVPTLGNINRAILAELNAAGVQTAEEWIDQRFSAMLRRWN